MIDDADADADRDDGDSVFARRHHASARGDGRVLHRHLDDRLHGRRDPHL